MSNEQISALVDGEGEAGERQCAIDQLLSDSAQQSAWQRYHIIGDTLRANRETLGSEADKATSANVVPIRTTAPANKTSSRLPLAGLAIAASVAVLAVVVVLKAPSDNSQQFDVAAKAPVASITPASVALTPAATPPAQSAHNALREQRLNGYLVNFNEQRARVGVRGVHPYVRIVGFETE